MYSKRERQTHTHFGWKCVGIQLFILLRTDTVYLFDIVRYTYQKPRRFRRILKDAIPEPSACDAQKGQSRFRLVLGAAGILVNIVCSRGEVHSGCRDHIRYFNNVDRYSDLGKKVLEASVEHDNIYKSGIHVHSRGALPISTYSDVVLRDIWCWKHCRTRAGL